MPRTSLMLVVALWLSVSIVASGHSAAQESRPFKDAHPLLAAGPMLGPAGETEVALWIQTTASTTVRATCEAIGEPAFGAATLTVVTMANDAFCATLRFTDLPFGRRFRCRIVFGDEVVDLPLDVTFQTQPHWRFRTDPPDFSVAFGSCSFINDPAVDRPNQSYGGENDIFGAIADQKPDLMLWLGDNVYFREPDWASESGMRRRYSYDRRLPELQRLLSTTHHYAIWDDHDYGPDNSDWTFDRKAAALRTFRLFWPNPAYGIEDTPGCFFRFTWGDAEFFMLDDRWWRSPNETPAGPDKRMFGPGQMRWLVDSLTSSRARFKIVAAGNQMLNPRIPHEAFGHFPAERAALLDAVAERRITGLLFLSGDRHHTEVIRLDRPGSTPLLDFTSSPLTSGLHVAKDDEDNPARVPGTLVADRRNFGLLHFRGQGDARTLTLECRDTAGSRFEVPVR